MFGLLVFKVCIFLPWGPFWEVSVIPGWYQGQNSTLTVFQRHHHPRGVPRIVEHNCCNDHGSSLGLSLATHHKMVGWNSPQISEGQEPVEKFTRVLHASLIKTWDSREFPWEENRNNAIWESFPVPGQLFKSLFPTHFLNTFHKQRYLNY